MVAKNMPYPDQQLYDYVTSELLKRNITKETIGEVAYEMQHKYFPGVTKEEFGSELNNVLKKREVLNNLAIGLELDNLANAHKLSEPLQTIIANDLGQFGVDESIALNISHLYGSISDTNYGYADKVKMGYAKKLDTTDKYINTFSDDLFLALCSAVCARWAHGSATVQENESFK